MPGSVQPFGMSAAERLSSEPAVAPASLNSLPVPPESALSLPDVAQPDNAKTNAMETRRKAFGVVESDNRFMGIRSFMSTEYGAESPIENMEERVTERLFDALEFTLTPG